MDTPRNQFTLGDIQVVPSRNEIQAGDTLIKLQPKVMEVLVYLAHHHDRVIGKEELIEHVWRGRVVTDASVQKSINLLRKCFAEAVGDADVIAHYSKRGYQLQIQPDFTSVAHGTAEPGLASGAEKSKWRGAPRVKRAAIAAGVTALLLLGAIGALRLFDINRAPKNHASQFESLLGYTNEIGHETMAEPNPVSEHVAYVRQAYDADVHRMSSALLIRDSKRQDWQFASSQGVWVHASWSPSGNSLAAIEQLSDDYFPTDVTAKTNDLHLYDIHIFELDLQTKQVVEKHRLSQWQGQVSSVTWSDEDTIELTAKQGASSRHLRYSYSLNAQRLEVVTSPEFIANPLQTYIHNQRAAIASSHLEGIRVDFVDAANRRLSSHIVHGSADLNWLPDGSGLVAHAAGSSILSFLYVDGTRTQIQLPPTGERILRRPRFAADGQRIFSPL